MTNNEDCGTCSGAGYLMSWGFGIVPDIELCPEGCDSADLYEAADGAPDNQWESTTPDEVYYTEADYDRIAEEMDLRKDRS